MRIRVQGNAVRAQLGHLRECPVKRLRALQWQTINQVNVNRLKAPCTGGRHQGEHLLRRLHTVDRFLHRGVEVLHTKTKSVETQFRQGIQALGVHGAGVDLNGVFAPGRECKVATQHGHQLTQFVIAQKCRTPTAQMQLADDLPQPDQLGMQIDFPIQIAQVLRRLVMVLGNDLVTCTVVTQGLAKRNMNIQGQRQGQRCCAAAPLGQCLGIVVSGERLHKPVGGGKRRVPRAGYIVSAQQFIGNGFSNSTHGSSRASG